MAAGKQYFRVGPAIWDEAWDDDTRYVAFYVLTCRHRTTEGLFRLPLEYAIADTGWSPERFREAFDKLLADGFIDYDSAARVCLIVKALEWQAPDNPNQVKAAMKLIEPLPATYLLVEFIRLADRYCERLAQALAERFPEPFREATTQGMGESPSPAPSPSQSPPGPPKGVNSNGSDEGSNGWPEAPVGHRKRDQVRFDASCSLLAARLFPNRDPAVAVHCVQQAIQNGNARDDAAILAWAERWYPELRANATVGEAA
jgi:hypothetical protein